MSDYKRHFQTNVINDKSQDSVATHLRCGEIFSSHIFTNLLLSLQVKKKLFKSVNIWQNYRQEGGLHVHEAVSCDADDTDAYNRSFCGLCSMDTVKMFCQLIK